jgi:hypothetical protein
VTIYGSSPAIHGSVMLAAAVRATATRGIVARPAGAAARGGAGLRGGAAPSLAIWRPRHVDMPVIGKRSMTVFLANPVATKPPYVSASDRCP